MINSQMAEYGDMAIAGMGVAMKVTIITGMISMGLGQGVQPLLGYCAGAKLWKRFKAAFRFSRILLTTGFLFGLFYVLVNGIQAMEAAAASLIISLSRQGIVYIPALFILKAALGLTGLAWTQPITDIFSIILAAILYIRTYRRLSGN